MTRSHTDATTPRSEPARNPMAGITAALATIGAASELRVTEATIEAGMARSTWGSVQEMLAREFEGPYRAYYPKCRMDAPDEAVIAAVFDALATLKDDPRRALRTQAGGRSDG